MAVRAITTAPPAPMPASSHWKSLLGLAETFCGWASATGFSGQVGADGTIGFERPGIGACWSGDATSVPGVTLPDALAVGGVTLTPAATSIG